MGGIVIAKDDNEMLRNIRDIQKEAGAVPSPHDCWLISRGIQTLSCRIHSQCDNAEKVSSFLANNKGVEKVFYPGNADHSNYDLAVKQMKRFGAMLSFTVAGDRRRTMTVAANLKLIRHATSLGGTHTLIEHRESVEGPDTLAPENLLRLSIGLEHHEDLINDLDQAISKS
jgi:cystathionine gamma-synthase